MAAPRGARRQARGRGSPGGGARRRAPRFAARHRSGPASAPLIPGDAKIPASPRAHRDLADATLARATVLVKRLDPGAAPLPLAAQRVGCTRELRPPGSVERACSVG